MGIGCLWDLRICALSGVAGAVCVSCIYFGGRTGIYADVDIYIYITVYRCIDLVEDVV